MLKRVLAAQEKVLGPEHPHTLHTMRSLATALKSQGHYSEAETLLKRVAIAQEKTAGGRHSRS
jgi:hypothetical protein